MAGREDEQALVPFHGSTHPIDRPMGGRSSDSSGNGAHGDAHGPLVTFPAEQDVQASHGAAPAPQFFHHAPQFHWHVHAGTTEDGAACAVVERIARDAHAFGAETGQRITALETRIGTVEPRIRIMVEEVRADFGRNPIEVELPSHWRDQWREDSQRILGEMLQEKMAAITA